MAKAKRTLLMEKMIAHAKEMQYNTATLLMAVAWLTTNKLEIFVNELINSDKKQ